MDTNIVLHPAAKLRKMIEATDAIDADYFIEMLIFAFENEVSRKPLLELVSPCKVQTERSLKGIRRFVEWCRNISFLSEDKLSNLPIDKEPSAVETLPPEDLIEEFVKLGAQCAQSAHKEYNYGYNHKYWFFRPAWEVDTTVWEQTFGEHDPCKIITFYLRGFFNNNTTYPYQRETVVLKQEDLSIIDFMLSFGSKELYEDSQSSVAGIQTNSRRALITACRVYEVVNEGLEWRDEDFCEIVGKSPEWIAINLIDYWSTSCELDDVGDEEQSVQEHALAQSRFISGCIIKHLTHASEFNLNELDSDDFELFPSFAHISDQTIFNVCLRVSFINSGTFNDDNLEYLLSKAICNSRINVFGGVFPFSFDNAHHCLWELKSEAGFWLAHISAFHPDAYGGADFPNSDDYKVSDARNNFESGEVNEIRTNKRAIRRLNAYRDAFESIKSERLNELAKAWWAFFIASQAIAFRGFGLSATQLADVVDIASSLLPDEAVQKALRFALRVTEELSSPLRFRVTKSLVSGLFTKADVIDLTTSNKDAVAFLKKRLGTKTWTALGDQSRIDLIEVEQLWSRCFFELGAGRADWGALILLYSRAIEAEVREHIGPLVNELQKAGVCQVKEMTLGGCAFAIRSAADAMRKSGGLPISERDSLAVNKLHEFFVKEHSFIEAYRNRAAHGNREYPITGSEYYRWREMIYDGGFFKVITESRSG